MGKIRGFMNIFGIGLTKAEKKFQGRLEDWGRTGESFVLSPGDIKDMSGCAEGNSETAAPDTLDDLRKIENWANKMLSDPKGLSEATVREMHKLLDRIIISQERFNKRNKEKIDGMDFALNWLEELDDAVLNDGRGQCLAARILAYHIPTTSALSGRKILAACNDNPIYKGKDKERREDDEFAKKMSGMSVKDCWKKLGERTTEWKKKEKEAEGKT